MKQVAIYLLDVVTFIVLLIGGFALADFVFDNAMWEMPIAILPALLQLKFRKPTTWRKFLEILSCVALLGIVLHLLHSYEINNRHALMLSAVIVVALVSSVWRKLGGRRAEQNAEADQ